jgi:hypothetical protein
MKKTTARRRPKLTPETLHSLELPVIGGVEPVAPPAPAAPAATRNCPHQAMDGYIRG